MGGGWWSLATVLLHRTDVLDARDLRTRDGLRVTAPARTLLDLAVIDGPAFTRALNKALVHRMVPPHDLEAALAERRRGTARLRAALDAGPSPTRSVLERRFLALVRDAGLPRPETTVRVGRFEVDALWRTQRLIVELDGCGAHSARAAFEADRVRDAEHQAAGYRTLRVTWRRLVERPSRVVADLSAALAVP